MFNHSPRCLLAVGIVSLFLPSLTLGKGLEITPYPWPAKESVRYTLTWMEVPLGEATVIWHERAKTYGATFELQTSGVAELFSDQHLSAMVSGIKQPIGGGRIRYVPSLYLSRKVSDIVAETQIRYDPFGNVRQLSVQPPDDPAYRPRVSRGGMHSSYDPLTAVLGLAAGLRPFPLFDGKRVIQAVITDTAPTTEEAQRGEQTLQLTRFPLEGHTEKELKRMKDDRPVRAVIMAKNSRFPYLLEADTRFGTFRAQRQVGTPIAP